MSMYWRMTLVCLYLVTGLSLQAQPRVESRLSGKKIKGLVREEGSAYFLVVGDWGRNGQGDQQKVADWMGVAANQVNARFIISTGDNFYCCGVASTEDYQWITSFENVFRSHSLQIPWYTTLGNHDYQGNVQAQIDYSTKSQRWKMPARYFTSAMYDTRFVFIDTSPLIGSYYNDAARYSDLSRQDTSRQLIWLDSVLVNAGEKWKIVVGHHPIYSVGEHGSEPDMQRLVGKKLKKHGVHVYFAGHDHSLQSLQPKGSSVLHLISGGGSEYTSIKSDPSLVRFARSTSGFMVVSLNRKGMKINIIDSQGQLIHTETIAP